MLTAVEDGELVRMEVVSIVIAEQGSDTAAVVEDGELVRMELVSKGDIVIAE